MRVSSTRYTSYHRAGVETVGIIDPQVAVQYNWDAERFLAETCRKAGLEPDAWKRGATIEGFTAEVFGEQSDGGAEAR